jgi:hypothetical protein
MGVQFKQLADGSVGMEGVARDAGAFILVPVVYAATSTSASVFTAPRACVVQGISGRVEVSGTGGACTFSLFKAPSGTAGASGVLLHTGTFNVAGTAATTQALTLNPGAGLSLAAGDSIYMALTGTATSAVGNVTIALNPA